MSKKKSLGSSPIGFHAKSSSMGFIPDLGVSKNNKKGPQSKSHRGSAKEHFINPNSPEAKKKKSEKKIVSYNLEITLIEKIKSVADQKNMYYSSLVSSALKRWIAENG